MKKLLLLIVIFCALKVNAQPYLISFAGIGESSTVNTVKVENLTAGTSLTIEGSDILRLTGPVGITHVDNHQSSGINIYPNPMTGISMLQIYPPEAGKVIITVFDVTGKSVAQFQSYLEKNLQEFRLSGLNTGFYLVSIRGSNYQYSGKLLCNGKPGGGISIEKISNNQIADVKTAKMDYKGTQATVDMAYTTGDRLKFTGISGIYSTVMTDIPTENKTITFNFISCKDGDGNNYPVVQIDTQVWMAENLKTTSYRNGNLIGTTTPPILNITSENSPKYQWPSDGIESNAATYGRLYTWYAVTDIRNLCPTGWHMPNDDEWSALTTWLGGESEAGGKLKETGKAHWLSPNTGATNETGFTVLPGGSRLSGAMFFGINLYGFWWSATENNASNAWFRFILYNKVNVYRGDDNKKSGFSVRCVMD